MIIKKSSIVNKKHSIIILSTSIAIDAIVLLLVIAATIVTYQTIKQELQINKFIIILYIVGAISIADFISISRKKVPIAWKLIRKINSKKKRYAPISSVFMNTEQKKFCEKVLGIENKNQYIYLYGKQNKGKTTAILYLLEALAENESTTENISRSASLTFIDCTNQKEEILDFFCMNNSLSNRISKFADNLIVMDNIECLGTAFLEENIDLFGSHKSFFILIEDTTEGVPMCNPSDLNNALLVKNFDNSVIGIKQKLDFSQYLLDFSSKEKKFFFALYISTFSSAFANLSDLRKILGAEKKEFNKALKKINTTNIFLPFPFNKKYYLCYQRANLQDMENYLLKDIDFNLVLELFIKSEIPTSECRWLCLIKSSSTTINRIPEQERIELFHKALKNGNYQFLYQELCKAIQINPIKSELFIYESAFLAFYAGEHKKATQLFSVLIGSILSPDMQKETMLHIVESSHGNPNADSMKNIENIIAQLKQNNDFYSICAQYWEVHMQTEKGIFPCSSMAKIRESIVAFNAPQYTHIKNSIIQRSFTDEIRCRHILGEEVPYALYCDYRNFLSKGSINRYNYFYNLYVEANDIHYIKILNCVLGLNSGNADLEELVKAADYYYKKALSSAYSDKKSRRATKIKHADLKLMFADFNYEEIIREINLFRTHSQINDVGVHEAFCETLLIKATVLNPNNISNSFGFSIPAKQKSEIRHHYDKGYDIYTKYHNQYGIFRLNFMMLLIDLLVNKSYGSTTITNLQAFEQQCNQYAKERKILQDLIVKISHNELTTMYLLSIIRAYPIILQ